MNRAMVRAAQREQMTRVVVAAVSSRFNVMDIHEFGVHAAGNAAAMPVAPPHRAGYVLRGSGRRLLPSHAHVGNLAR